MIAKKPRLSPWPTSDSVAGAATHGEGVLAYGSAFLTVNGKHSIRVWLGEYFFPRLISHVRMI